jgi:microcystin-dependent protein
VAFLGSTTFIYAATSSCVLGDIVLSINGYGQGALPADGRLLSISGNTAVFSIMGTNFGGDGVTNFALPDLRKFAPQGLQYSICVEGIFPSRF